MRLKPNPVNDELALLMGWQWRLGGSTNHKCRFLCPPDTPEGRNIVGLNYPTYTMDQVYPLASGADTICADYNRYVPRYEEDDAEALRLQVYLARLPEVHAVAMSALSNRILILEIHYGPAQCSRGRNMKPSKAITTAALHCLRDIAQGPLFNPMAPAEIDGPDA